MTRNHIVQIRYPSLREMTDRFSGMIRKRLWAQVLLGMVLGVATGLLIGPTGGLLPERLAAEVSNWLALPGHVFLALVQMIVIPLVIASIILGMASSDSMAQLRSTGIHTGLFFLATTIVAVLIGMGVVLILQPGEYIMDVDLISGAVMPEPVTPSLSELPQRISEVIPANPLKASLEQNMLQVVVFAMLVGVALVTMPTRQGRPILDLLASIQQLTMVVVRWAMFLAPFAVFGLLAQVTARTGLEALAGMAAYVATVIIGLLLALVMYLLLYLFWVRRSPIRFLAKARDALLLAFSTSSSAAVMPLTIRVAEERLGIRPAVSRFVIPLGTTINMGGTALYQVVATLFLAQVFMIDVGLVQLMLVVLLAVGASIGSPGTPGVGIVILAMLLGTIGIPPEGIALIIGVDRILDMMRTTLNVTGDLVAASVIERGYQEPRLPPPVAASGCDGD
ncbi:MAG: dicarboxylate/amino acid:cation symporter [Halothiobacillaceae bacterium]